MPADTVERRLESAARRRVLDTAAALFYAEGVHAVGIDRIIAEAKVAKATFYHHFPAKDELVSAYLREEYGRHRRALAEVRDASGSPRDALLGIFDAMGQTGTSSSYRGCPFINAAAEFPDADHPVRRAIDDHRQWMFGQFRDLLSEAGCPDPDDTAGILMMIRDGLSVGCDLGDADAIRSGIRDAVVRILDAPR